MKETWSDIKGFEKVYQVSDLGNVRSLDRIVSHSYYGVAHRKGVVIVACLNPDGYPQVRLQFEGMRKTVAIHTLVATAFVTRPDHTVEVNHINGVKTDNRAINLEWVTHKQNMNHSFDTGLNKNTKQKVEVGGVVYESISAASKATNVNPGHLHQALTGKLTHAKGIIFRKVS